MSTRFVDRIPWLALIAALAGLAVTIVGGSGRLESVCVTQGCSLFKEARILGLSIWWWGAGAFGVAALLSLIARLDALRFWAGLLLLMDAGFLLVLAFTSTCLSCLLAAAMFCMLFLAAVRPWRRSAAMGRWVLVIWLLMLMPNLALLGREAAEPWPVLGDADAPVQVIFSPTCSHCREVVKSLLLNMPDDTAFFPVAKDAEEREMVMGLVRELKSETPLVAFERMFEGRAQAGDQGWWERTGIRFRLFRNRLRLLALGSSTVPVTVIRGEFSFGADGGVSSGWSDGLFGGCEEDGDEECAE